MPILLTVCNNSGMKNVIKHLKSVKLLNVKFFNQLNVKPYYIKFIKVID